VATIKGTSGDDTLTGSQAADRMSGLNGDDVLYGFNGSDLLIGGAGNDELFGSEPSYWSVDDGHDTLRGGAGDDFLNGGFGNNLLEGGTGDDVLAGTGTLIGGAGNDTVWGDDAPDILRGGGGNDVLSANQYDRVHGGSGLDTLTFRYTTNGHGRHLDLTSVADDRIQGIEIIDILGYLTLDESEILALSPSTDTLIVRNSSSRPTETGINIVGDFTDEGIHDGYHHYQVGAAMLLVDTDITNVT
jgi:Ca2+-binding RTX toxin-like protein